jgi:hypothetical protein
VGSLRLKLAIDQQRAGLLEAGALAVFSALFILLSLSSMARQSATFDETAHPVRVHIRQIW